MTTTSILDGLIAATSFVFHASLGATSSYATAELVRDGWHLLGHKVPFLWKHIHASHHQVFVKGWKIPDQRRMLQSQWVHGVTEASLMLFAALGFAALCFRCGTALGIGSLLGVGYTIRILGLALLHALDVLTPDALQIPGVYMAPPTGGLTVDQAYHHAHHFGDIESAYSGVSKLFDQVMGTARSLKRQRIGITVGATELTEALIGELWRQQVRSITLFCPPDLAEGLSNMPEVKVISWRPGREAELQVAMEEIDILILNHALASSPIRDAATLAGNLAVSLSSVLRLAEGFFGTVQGNERIAGKELWVSTSMATTTGGQSTASTLQRQAMTEAIAMLRLEAPCIVRQLVLGNVRLGGEQQARYPMLTPQWAARAILFWIRRDVRFIVVSLDPIAIAAAVLREIRGRRPPGAQH